MKVNRSDLAALFLTTLISLIYWNGTISVPFHPDESTQIFMSGDTELFIQNPFNLAWSASKNGDPRQVYRLLDAPLTRDLIGAGRILSNLPPLAVDWNWSNTWSQNQLAGALPSPSLLLAARLSVDWMFPFTLILMYLIGKKVAGPRLGLLALIALAANSLVLLHTRRAMAESGLLFTTLLALWGLISFKKKAWLAAFPAALAVAAKQTSVAFIVAGLVCISIQSIKTRKLLFRNLGFYLAIILVLTFTLNPFLWLQPVDAAVASLNARQDLIMRQINEFHQSIPGLVYDTIPERALGMIANLYFTPLQFNEVGNYLAQTQDAETEYLANPMHTLLRSLPGGMILLFLSLIGLALAVINIKRKRISNQHELIILVFTTIIVALTILLTIPLSFQRYMIPLVPFTTLLVVYPIDWFIGFALDMGRLPRPMSRRTG